MNDEKYLNLLKTAKRNFYIMQGFTYATALIFFCALFMYINERLNEFGTVVYYSFFAMGVVSLILGFTFSKKLSLNRDIVESIFRTNPAYFKKFVKNSFFQKIINAVLIFIIIISFFMNGVQLQFINNIFFLLVIFSYWYSSYNYYMMLKQKDKKLF